MKKQIRRWVVRLAATFLFLAVLLVMIVLNPALTYANKTAHGRYTIFHNQPLDPSFITHLDQATKLVSASEYYDPRWTIDVCLNDGSIYPKIIGKVWSRAFGRGFYNKVVLMEETASTQNWVALNGFKWNLEQLLAHEMIHCFQFHHRGLWKSKPVAAIPDWKWEGYSEYIARQQADQKDLLQNIDRLIGVEKTAYNDWISFADGSGTIMLYYRYWLLVQYCMNIKGMHYDQLIDDGLQEEAVWKQLMDWYEPQKRMTR